MTAKNQIVYRDRITVYGDAAPEGATQPAYTDELARGIPAEILQVSGGEVIRGKQVEAMVSHVIGFRFFPCHGITAKARVTVTSGMYKDQVLYVHRVHFETQHGRPYRMQLHCKTKQ